MARSRPSSAPRGALAGGLELGPQAEEAELVVPRDVEARAQLVEQEEQPLAVFARHGLEPGLDPRRGGLLHDAIIRARSAPPR